MTGQALSRLTLTALVLLAITGCRDEQKIASDQNALIRISLENLITVKGGEFQMGDFGRLVDEHLPFNPDQDTPLHSVTLSDFRIGKYRVTWGEFNRWLIIQGRDKNTIYQTISQGKYFSKQDKEALGETYPATASWQDARNYCQWLGKASNRKIDLPPKPSGNTQLAAGGSYLFSLTPTTEITYGTTKIVTMRHPAKKNLSVVFQLTHLVFTT